jgi:hypothetical protein
MPINVFTTIDDPSANPAFAVCRGCCPAGDTPQRLQRARPYASQVRVTSRRSNLVGNFRLGATAFYRVPSRPPLPECAFFSIRANGSKHRFTMLNRARDYQY